MIDEQTNIAVGERVFVLPIRMYGKFMGRNAEHDHLIDVELELKHTTKDRQVTASCFPFVICKASEAA